MAEAKQAMDALLPALRHQAPGDVYLALDVMKDPWCRKGRVREAAAFWPGRALGTG